MTATLAGINDWVIQLFFGQEADSMVGRGATGSDALFLFIWWFSVFFFVLLMGIMAYCMVVYRRKEGDVPIRSSSHNTPLEIAWSVLPALPLVVMFFWGFDGYLKASMAPSYAEQIELTAQKWSWTMEYSTGIGASEFHTIGGNNNTPIFFMPAETPVRLKMHSEDVLHAFWVPDFRTKIDVVPNRYTPYVFTAVALDRSDERVDVGLDKQGKEYFFRDHTVFCAEYCGDQHSEMVATLRIVEPAFYKTWVNTPAYDEKTPPIEVGQLVWQAKCAVCHTTDGGVSTGPTWLNSYGYPREFADGSSMTQATLDSDPLEWDNYIRESIILPGAKVRAGFENAMPSFDGQINNVELRGVTEYLKSLSDRAPESPIDEVEESDAEAAGEADGE